MYPAGHTSGIFAGPSRPSHQHVHNRCRAPVPRQIALTMPRAGPPMEGSMPNGHSFRRVLVFLVIVCATTMVGAHSYAAGEGSYPQVKLTSAIVKAFVASYPTVKATADKVGKKYEVQGDRGDQTGGWGGWMAATAGWAEMNAVVKPYGFSDFKTWLNTTINVALAYSFATHGAEMDAGMAQAVEQIKNNPSLSDAQKKMMIQQMQASMGAVDTMRPPQGNIDAVKPYSAQLATFFNGD